MHISNIIFLIISSIFILYLFFCFFIDQTSSIKSPHIISNIFKKNSGLTLFLSVSFLIVVSVIFAYRLSTVPISNHNPQTLYPLNPYNTYLHLVILIFALFLMINKIITYKDMGFIFFKNSSKEGMFFGSVLILIIPGLFLRTIFSPETLTFNLGNPLLYVTVGITLIPISQEIFFRGILQSKLQNIKKLPEISALFLASLAYALFHIPKILFTPEFVVLPQPFINISQHPFLVFLAYLIFGFYFGYIYKKTKSIYWPILAHIILSIMYFMFVIR